jgi:flagellar protein FlaG
MISTAASPPAAAELAARAAASPTAPTGVVPASEAQEPTAAAHRPSPHADRFDPIRLRENLAEAIEQINKQLTDSGRNLGISMDQVLNWPVVKVVNTQTGELVRQIPSEAVLKVAHTLEALKGLLYDATT